MKVLICGAGQVGFGIAERLSAEENDVSIIDNSPGLIQRVSDILDVRGFVGHGSHPDVLDEAGAPDADMIIAVTLSRRGQYGRLSGRPFAVQHSDEDRARAVAELSRVPLARSLFPRTHADRRDHLAGDRGRRHGAAAPQSAGRVRDGELRRRPDQRGWRDVRGGLPGRRHAV